MKTFIHLSDLHVAALRKPGLEGINKRTEKTWLIAQDDEKNHFYIKDFCENVQTEFDGSEREFYLLITGDIADSSLDIEYQYAANFLEQIVKELKIKKEHILIVPGNHDVSWLECQKAANENLDKPAYQHVEAKYSHFKRFYDSFFEGSGKVFESDKQIVDCMILQKERILFVGVNTNYKITYEGGGGAVDIDAFNVELTKICEDYPDYSKIALFHHNIVSDSEEDNSTYGDWGKDDWLNFKKALEKNNFKFVIFGNEHVRASSISLNSHRGENAMYFSDSGSFALHDNDCNPTYKVYELVQNVEKTTLRQYLFELLGKGTNKQRVFGNWRKQINKVCDELDEFVLQENTASPFDKKIKVLSTDLGGNSNDDSSNEAVETKLVLNTEDAVGSLSNKEFQDMMMEIIKSEHLYHPGHFHWGRSSRSHNWIDTISLLNDKQHIQLIQKEVLKVVMEVKKAKAIKFDAIIGLGMEGNVMSTQLLLDEAPYTFLPYTYRYDDFNEFEKNICLDNETGKYKKVLIITDVVNKGRMLKSLIEEKDAAFFSRVEQIHIVSLFYTGKYEDREMPDGLKDIKDKTIGFYSLLQLEVGECPYDDAFKEKCIIYKEHLCDVYEFYSKK